MIDAYLSELARALCVRGRARRRFLAECREHLLDLSVEMGDQDAITTFGSPDRLAAAFDAEVATHRGLLASWWTGAGVLAVGGSTLALIHASNPVANASPFWAVAFFVFAQVAAVCAALAFVQGLRSLRSTSSAPETALLCRRTALALVAAGAAMFSAGAALPGRGSAALLLVGPALASLAGVAVARAWRLTRRLDGARERIDLSPFADLRVLTRLPVPTVGPASLAALAALAAFLRDLAETGSSPRGSVAVGAIEAGLVLVAYVALRTPLGLRTLRA